MERQILENGCYSELEHIAYHDKPQALGEDLIKSFRKRCIKMQIPNSHLDMIGGKWTVTGTMFDEEHENPFGEETSLNFTEKGFASLLSELKIKKREIVDRPLNLIKQTYNQLKLEKPIVVLEIDGSVITNIFKLNAKYIPIEESLKSIDLEFNEILISDSGYRLMALTDKAFNVSVDDTHQVGWIFDGQNTKASSSIKAKLGTFRLVCLNGMTSMEEGGNFTYSREEYGNYHTGIKNFVEAVGSHDAGVAVEKLWEIHNRLSKKIPLNKDLIAIYKECKKTSGDTFGDEVIGWPVDMRRDSLRLASIKTNADIRDEFLQSENPQFGTSYDLMNRATHFGKSLSVFSQIQLQDFIGVLLKKEVLN